MEEKNPCICFFNEICLLLKKIKKVEKGEYILVVLRSLN